MLTDGNLIVRFNSLRELVKAQSLLEGQAIGLSNIKTTILFGSLKCRPDPENPYYELLDFQSNFAVNQKMEELRTREMHILENVSTTSPTLLRIPVESNDQAEFTHQLDENLSLDYEDNIGPALERESASRKQREKPVRFKDPEMVQEESEAVEFASDEESEQATKRSQSE